jgi:prevent-host-death family protein
MEKSMIEKKVAVAEAKSRFSELLSKVAHANQRIIVTKRQKPIAAIVTMDDLRRLNLMEKRSGLLSCVGKWDRFEEIVKDVEAAYNARNEDKPRNVSF